MKDQLLERNIDTLSIAFVEPLRTEHPNLTDGDIKLAARNFAEFIGALRAMDAEQRGSHE